MRSDHVVVRLIVNRMTELTPVKTLPSPTVGNEQMRKRKGKHAHFEAKSVFSKGV